MSIQFLLDSQQIFQGRMGIDFSKMTEEEQGKYLHEHSYFLIEETTEMLRELKFHKSWKNYDSWGPEEHKNAELKSKEEAIDMLHFMINIFLGLGMDEKEIITMYREKNKLNYDRQEKIEFGYIAPVATEHAILPLKKQETRTNENK